MISALQKYFRSAVLIDDDIERPVRTGGSIGSGDEPYVEPQPILDTPDETERIAGRGQNADSVTEAFLARDIVCSVTTLPKSEREDPVTRIARLAHSTDILILDWFIPYDERTTLDSLKQIKDQSHDRLVVVVILSEQNRLGIVGQIEEELQLDNCDDRYLRHRQLLVMVYNKPTVEVMDPPDPQRIDNYSDLPRHIMTDLDDAFVGLMPQFAFAGMNAIRDAMPTVLATFEQRLDLGGVLHRALLSPRNDAGHQFYDLLLREFADGLDHDAVAERWSDEAVDANLDLDGTIDVSETAKLQERLLSLDSERFKDMATTSCLREVLVHGMPQSDSGTVPGSAISRLVKSLPGFSDSNHALAALICSTPIRNEIPQLDLGVVLMDEHDKYLLCVQPRCDSVRISGRRRFPLVPLRVFPYSGNKRDVDIMFADGPDKYVAARFENRPHLMQNPEFESSTGNVVKAKQIDRECFFSDSEKRKYRAVTRLRPEFSNKALHALAGQLTRPGLDRSEWLSSGAINATPVAEVIGSA